MFQTLTDSQTYKEAKVRIISWQWLRQRLLSISPEEATFARRGFYATNAETQEGLEKIGHTFLQGYHGAIANNSSTTLVSQLNEIPQQWRGFAFEGAGMGLALLDGLTPWQGNRVQNFLANGGADHIYMVYVGLGWALARIPFAIERYLAQLDKVAGTNTIVSHPVNSWFIKPKLIDPILGWLAIDGYGFHQGYFYPSRYVECQALPEGIYGYALRGFDQGLGRSLWFVCGADVNRISRLLLDFHPNRRADLWSGIGLACTYAGGVDDSAIASLRAAAGDYQPQLAQGAAFAAKARLRAGNLTPHTEMAAKILCGMSPDKAAEITDIALLETTSQAISQISNSEIPAYEAWRLRIQVQFALLGGKG